MVANGYMAYSIGFILLDTFSSLKTKYEIAFYLAQNLVIVGFFKVIFKDQDYPQKAYPIKMAMINAAKSATSPQKSAYRLFFIPTLPKYTARI